MNFIKRQNNFIIYGFLGMELAIYILFLIIDIFYPVKHEVSLYLKYLSIIICFAFALLTRKKSESKDYRDTALKIGLVFTLISDYMLLLSDNYTFGVVTFIIVQICYLYRLSNCSTYVFSKVILRNIIIWAAGISVYIFFAGIPEILVIFAMYYFISILDNTLISVKKAFGKEKDKAIVIFAIGMCLFLLCDINVGIFNISEFMVIEGVLFKNIYKFSTVAMWLFYLPSQVLIVLSD